MPGSEGSERSAGAGAMTAVLEGGSRLGREPLDVLVVGERRLHAEALCAVLGGRGFRAQVSEAGPLADRLSPEIDAVRPAAVVIEVPDVRTSKELADLVPRLRRSGTPVLMLLPQRLRDAGAPARRPAPAQGPQPTPLDEFLQSVSRAVGVPAGARAPEAVRGAARTDRRDLAAAVETAVGPREGGDATPPPSRGGVSLHELRVGDLGQAIQHPSAVRSAPLTPSRGPLGSLTAKEGEVLRALMAGTPAPEVARELNVSVSTVRNHIRAILGKLGVRSQLAAVAAAYRAGWSRERRNPG